MSNPEHLLKHESYQDMLAIIQSGLPYERRTLAFAVIKHLGILYSRQILHLEKELKSMESWATRRHFADQSRLQRPRIEKLKELVEGLKAHRLPLCSFMEANAAEFVSEDKRWQWHVGDEIPKWPRKDLLGSEGLSEPLFVPKVRCC